MVPEKLVSRIVKLAASVALLLPAFAHGQSATLLNEVHTIATPDAAVPVEHTFMSTSAGSYTVTLTDLGAGLTPPAPLASATMAVTQGDTVVGKPVTLQQGTSTLTLTFTATANTSYAVHVVGSPAAGLTASSIGEDITAPDNSSVGTYVDSLALPTPQVANGEAILDDSFTVASADQYTITLTDLQLPVALKGLILAVIPTGGTPAATLPVPGTNAMTTTVPLSPGSYQLVAIGKTDSSVNTDVGGLFSASVVGTSGPAPYPAKIVTVGAVTLVESAQLPAGSYALTLTDLKFPSALTGGTAVLGAAVVRDDGVAMATLAAAGTQSFTVATSGNNYLAFAVANPARSQQGSYALQVQSTAPSPGAPPMSVARAVAATDSTLLPFSFDTTIPSAGSDVVTLTDFSFPAALKAVNVAAVQGASVLGTPLSQAGNFTITAAQGPLTLLAYGTAAASGGVFGVDVSPSSGSGSAVFDAAQPVGLAFVTRRLAITSMGTYLVSAADVGFPASFSSFDVLVTHGTQSVGEIFGGGKFTFDATSGTYFVDFVALPSGTDKAGTYSLSVATAPPAPTVTFSSSVSHVASGGTVALTWSTTNATTCAASNGWSGTQATSGSATSAALTGATTFTLTCSGDGGSAAQSVSVTIDSPTSPSGGGGHGGGALNLLTLFGLAGVLAARWARRTRISEGPTPMSAEATRMSAEARPMSRSGKTAALRSPPHPDSRNAIMLKRLAAAIVFLMPVLATANDDGARASRADSPAIAQIRARMKERYPEANVESIAPSQALPGWYELIVGKQIVYTDAAAERLIVGKVVDTRTREDLTQKRWSELHLIDFKALPFEDSIKTVRGKGEHVVAIFADPLCPYCQKLEQQMRGLQDVTIYTFLMPLESVHPGATIKSREIWCAKDRAVAWADWMLEQKQPDESKAGDCKEDPTGALLETASRLDLTSTPTLIFADGHRVIGAPTMQALESDLQHSVLPD